MLLCQQPLYSTVFISVFIAIAGLQGGAIAGIVIAVIFVTIVGIIVLMYYCRRGDIKIPLLNKWNTTAKPGYVNPIIYSKVRIH